MKAHTNWVLSASFSPDGRRIVTASSDNTARVWDASRTEAIAQEHAIVLTAALARGIGYRTDAERTDLLMQDASEDLFAEALKQLGVKSADPELADVVAALRAPLHPNCYLSPTEFAEKFGGISAPHPTEALSEPETPSDLQHAPPPEEPQSEEEDKQQNVPKTQKAWWFSWLHRS